MLFLFDFTIEDSLWEDSGFSLGWYDRVIYPVTLVFVFLF